MSLYDYLVVGFIGRMRTGKTLALLDYALRTAHSRQFGIVSNIPLRVEGVYKYAEYIKSDWLKYCCDRGLIISICAESQRDLLFRYPYKVIIFDEMGILLDARSWSENHKRGNFVKYLPQIGHLYCTLVYTAQYVEQIDSRVRKLTDCIAYVDGFSKYKKNYKLHENGCNINRVHIHSLFWRNVQFFHADKFFNWFESEERYTKPLNRFVKRSGSWWGALLKRHRLLFNCYDSHGKLGSIPLVEIPAIETIFRCNLKANYYLDNPKWSLYSESWADCPINRKRFYHVVDENLKDGKINYSSPLPADKVFLTDKPINVSSLPLTSKPSKSSSKVTSIDTQSVLDRYGLKVN